MSTRLVQYVAVIITVGLFMLTLPSIGRTTRAIHSRLSVFFTNIYYSQTQGEQLKALVGERNELASNGARLAQLERENDLLRRQLGVQPAVNDLPLLLAKVIGQGSTFGSETLIIDKGSKQGVSGGEVVAISPNILVGQVANVFDNYSIVLLVFNKESRLSAKSTSGSKGTVKGEVGKQVIMDEVSQASPLTTGDIIITDNQSPLVPAGLLIGKVEKIASQPTDIFKKALLTVLFQDATIDSVFIISPRAPL